MKSLLKYILLFVAIGCNAQTSISTQQICGTKWVKTVPEDSELVIKIEFLEEKLKEESKFILIDKELEFAFMYYLSPTVPESFDFSLVGKGTTGSYLVGFNSMINKMFYYQIISLTAEKLVLMRKGKSNSIGAGKDLYLTYRRVR